MSFKFNVVGIPLKLDRRKVGDDYVYQKVDTDTGRVTEFFNEREAIVGFFMHFEGKMLERGFRDSDFEEDDYCDEEFVAPTPADTDRSDKRKHLNELFDNIKEAAWYHRENEYKGLAEESAYISMVYLFELYRFHCKTKYEVESEIIKLRAGFIDFKKTEELNCTIYSKNQDFIRKSNNVLRFIQANIKTALPKELLLKAVEFICLERGETITYEKLKRRLENADREEGRHERD